MSLLFAGVDAGEDDDKVDDQKHKLSSASPKRVEKKGKLPGKIPPSSSSSSSPPSPSDPGTGAMKLFLLTPSGSEDATDAVAIGAGAEVASKDLAAGYRRDLTVGEAVALCLQVMKSVSADCLSEENVEIAKIERGTGPHVFSKAEIKKALKDAKVI